MTATAGRGERVAEIQGLYGSFSFPEKLLQQIWLLGDFDASRAVTNDGRRVRVLRAGKWNLLGGPDFKDAELELGGKRVTGAVELHLHASDWAAHAHANDPAYADVVLHVVLFPTTERVTVGANGREIPILALLPLLHHGLEEYAAEDAIARLANHSSTLVDEALASLSNAEVEELFRGHADARWRQKVYYAGARIERLGWEAACHHTALEILGYRFNRAPMLAVAEAHALERWACDGETTADAAFAGFRPRWSTQGVRPANHPRLRLRQYARWTAAVPRWPERLRTIGASLSQSGVAEGSVSTAAMRRHGRYAALRERFAADVCGGALGGTRLDNLICDGFLPLLAAGGASGHEALRAVWFHWFTGDLPAGFSRSLRALNLVDGRVRPLSHGLAQGLIGWLLSQEQKLAAASGAAGRGT